MFNVRLAGGHLYGKQMFTWLSLVVSLMASFCAVLLPLDVLGEILGLIESVSEGFLTYFCLSYLTRMYGNKQSVYLSDTKEDDILLFAKETNLKKFPRHLKK